MIASSFHWFPGQIISISLRDDRRKENGNAATKCGRPLRRNIVCNNLDKGLSSGSRVSASTHYFARSNNDVLLGCYGQTASHCERSAESRNLWVGSNRNTTGAVRPRNRRQIWIIVRCKTARWQSVRSYTWESWSNSSHTLDITKSHIFNKGACRNRSDCSLDICRQE